MNYTLRVLKMAREFIVKGWTQSAEMRSVEGYDVTNEGYDGKGEPPYSFTMRGAIAFVCRSIGDRDLARRTKYDAIEACRAVLQLDGLINTLATWNDAPERTKAEVLEVFDRAIAAEEKRETS